MNTNAENLRYWAQNEEMIDSSFSEHGIDCNKAADQLEALDAQVAALKVAVRQASMVNGLLKQRAEKAEAERDAFKALLRDYGCTEQGIEYGVQRILQEGNIDAAKEKP